MPAPDAYLGIDLGTSAVKALLVDARGRVLGQGSAEHPISHPRPHYAEQDAADWWRGVLVATQQAVGSTSQDRVAAIGLSGQMHGTVLLGPDDEVLAPAIIWPDQRSRRQVDEITELVGAERLIELTGSPVATGFQAASIRWVRQEQPRVWDRTRRVLLPKDEIRRRLTGNIATDPSDGSGALLLDVRQRDWSDELLATLNVERELLPPVHRSASVAGDLRSAVASQLGLPPGIPVVAGAADAACAALGAGIVDPSTMLLTFSTGAQTLIPSAEVKVDRRGRLHTFCSAMDPRTKGAGWYMMGATLTAGLAMRWLRDSVFALDGADAYDRMTTWAGETSLSAGGLLFLPYLVGERTPHMDPRARGLFLGLTARHGRAELVRAVMEGVVLAAYDAFTALTDLGATPTRIIVAGGGARSSLWRQIVADIFNLPVLPLLHQEQSASGAALLAAAGVHSIDPGTVAPTWAAYGEPTEPDAEHHAGYQDLFRLFRSSYVKHRNGFVDLGAFDTQDLPGNR